MGMTTWINNSMGNGRMTALTQGMGNEQLRHGCLSTWKNVELQYRVIGIGTWETGKGGVAN
jgi:hypothetical protein